MIAPEEVANDARIIVDYLGSFASFFGNGAGAVEAYWAFLVWLYAARTAPHLRHQAMQFARGVPDFVLKGRFADLVKLDLQALEQEMGFTLGRAPGWWRRVMGR